MTPKKHFNGFRENNLGEARQKQQNNFNQALKFSDEQIGTIKAFFAENDKALIAIRKVFLQKELDKIETEIVRGFTKEILDIIEKEMIPKINCDMPIQIGSKVKDWWSSFDFANMSLEKIAIDVQSRDIIISYLTQQFNLLRGEKVSQEIIFGDLAHNRNKNLQQSLIELVARGSIIKQVEDMLISFKIFAGEKKETLEETKKRLFQNSNK